MNQRSRHVEADQRQKNPTCQAVNRRTYSAAAMQSLLNKPMDLFGGNREDAYAFTHAVMYTADFNIHPVPFPRSRQVLLQEAECALARALSVAHDMTGLGSTRSVR